MRGNFFVTQADEPVIIKVTFDDSREVELVLTRKSDHKPENTKE